MLNGLVFHLLLPLLLFHFSGAHLLHSVSVLPVLLFFQSLLLLLEGKFFVLFLLLLLNLLGQKLGHILLLLQLLQNVLLLDIFELEELPA